MYFKLHSITRGAYHRQEGRGKREEGRGKREEGRGKSKTGRALFCKKPPSRTLPQKTL
jgi:hypothetical protein